MMRGKRHPVEEAITIVIGAKPKAEGEEPLEDEEPGEYETTEEDEEMDRMLRRLGA